MARSDLVRPLGIGDRARPDLQRMVLNGCRDQARRTRRLRRLLPRLAASASAQPSEILWDVLASVAVPSAPRWCNAARLRIAP
ncbi:MAG: hypothetical protein R2710_02955 [Acidimicrobiales bacterium]